MLFSGYCKPNIIRNFLLSILTLNIFKIYNGAHHVMFLNFRAPNSYKLHAYKNWIINTLIIINVSFLYYEVGFFFFLSFTVCLLLFDFTVLFCLWYILDWMVLNAIYQVIVPNWSQCISQPTTRRGWICEDLRETDNDSMVVSFIQWFIPLRQSGNLWSN